MEREELLKNEGYWISKIQTELYREVIAFMERNKMNSTQLAHYLGCSKSYISQLLNGNFNHKLTKLVELSLAIGKAPIIEFRDLKKVVKEDTDNISTIRSKNRIRSHTHISAPQSEYLVRRGGKR